MRNIFWKGCVVWALALGSIAVARSYLGIGGISDRRDILPPLGERLELPSTLTSTTGQVIPALAVGAKKTLFLVTWAGCPICRRELSTYGHLLKVAEESGFATRLLITPGSAEQNEWFLGRAPKNGTIIFDTLGKASSALRAKVTPSIVIVSSSGIVDATFSPSRRWPVTEQDLIQVAKK